MAEIQSVVADLKTRLRKFPKEFAVEFQKRCEDRSPVRTGALKGGWGNEVKNGVVEIYNTKDYASFVEMGTVHHAPVGMMRATALEAEEIAALAVERSKKK